MGANVYPSYSKLLINYTLQSEESESVNLQGLQGFNYNESQFIATVNDKYEKIINFKREGNNIFFETDSLLITPDSCSGSQTSEGWDRDQRQFRLKLNANTKLFKLTLNANELIRNALGIAIINFDSL